MTPVPRRLPLLDGMAADGRGRGGKSIEREKGEGVGGSWWWGWWQG